MKKKILIDTDVVIDFLKGVNKAVKYIKSHSDEIVLSVITVSELYAELRMMRGRNLTSSLASFLSSRLQPKLLRKADFISVIISRAIV